MKRIFHYFSKTREKVVQGVQNLNIERELFEMFKKIGDGKVSREDGAFMLRDFIKRDKDKTLKALQNICKKPPTGVFLKTIIHTIALTKNQAFADILEKSFNLSDEGAAIVAAEGLAGIGGIDTRPILSKYLQHDCYHVRKASSYALVHRFHKEGISEVINFCSKTRDLIYIISVLDPLVKAGDEGFYALLKLMESHNIAAIQVAADNLKQFKRQIHEDHIPIILKGLETVVKEDHGSSFLSVFRLIQSIHVPEKYNEQISHIIKPHKKKLESQLGR